MTYTTSLFNTVPPKRKGEVDPGDACPRCEGKGGIEGFAHVQGGICFRCLGTGVELTPAERAKEMKLLRP